MDFLFGEPRFLNALDPDRSEKKAFMIQDEGLLLANRLEKKRVARQCSEWIREKVNIRSVKQANFLHGKMCHIANGNAESAMASTAGHDSSVSDSSARLSSVHSLVARGFGNVRPAALLERKCVGAVFGAVV